MSSCINMYIFPNSTPRMFSIIMNTFKDLIKLKDADEGNIVNLFFFF